MIFSFLLFLSFPMVSGAVQGNVTLPGRLFGRLLCMSPRFCTHSACIGASTEVIGQAVTQSSTHAFNHTFISPFMTDSPISDNMEEFFSHLVTAFIAIAASVIVYIVVVFFLHYGVGLSWRRSFRVGLTAGHVVSLFTVHYTVRREPDESDDV